jgi:hypothetical protein
MCISIRASYNLWVFCNNHIAHKLAIMCVILVTTYMTLIGPTFIMFTYVTMDKDSCVLCFKQFY